MFTAPKCVPLKCLGQKQATFFARTLSNHGKSLKAVTGPWILHLYNSSKTILF